ncbi:MAG: cation transporter [Halothiobacillus sp.]|nr:cation transporter [Halothiobacillus sp.]
MSTQTQQERATLRIALALNVAMFVIGMAAGLWAQSTGLIADSLDMLADAAAYALALLAVTRGLAFKRDAARWSGWLLLILGAGIILDVTRRTLLGSEPQGDIMMLFAVISLIVNVIVLNLLSRFRHGEVHLRTTWVFTRMDVLANIGVFASGLVVSLTHLRYADLVIGLIIGLYVMKEARDILRDAAQAPCADGDAA